MVLSYLGKAMLSKEEGSKLSHTEKPSLVFCFEVRACSFPSQTSRLAETNERREERNREKRKRGLLFGTFQGTRNT